MISTIFYLNERGTRKNIEDSIYPLPNKATINDKLFMVCDGVGGLSKGEEASRVTCESISNYLKRLSGKEITVKDIERALDYNYQEMQRYVAQHPEAEQMSTTLTLAYFNQDRIFVAWCGDSRIYHIRNGKVLWQSKDHSLVQQLVDAGEISVKEANSHPKKNIILRSLNASKNNSKTDINCIDSFKKGDWLLLCTDGVLENIDNEAIDAIFSSHQKNTDKKQLFLNYCEGKTSDNFSMYLLQISSNAKTKSNVIKIAVSILLLIILLFVGYTFWFAKSKKQKETKEIQNIQNATPQNNQNNNSSTNRELLEQLEEHSKKKDVVPVEKKPTNNSKSKTINNSQETKKEIIKREIKTDTSKIVKVIPVQEIKKDTLK